MGGGVGIGPPEDWTAVDLTARHCYIICGHPWPGRKTFKCPSCSRRGAVILAKQHGEFTRLGRLLAWLTLAWRDCREILRLRDPDRPPEPGHEPDWSRVRWDRTFIAAGQRADWTIEVDQ